MNKQNFALIKKNKFYLKLYDILENEKLFMDKPDQKDIVEEKIRDLIDSEKILEISETFNKKEELLEDIFYKMSKSTTSRSGNSLLINCNQNYMYQLIYLEEENENLDNENLNEYCSLSNKDITPVYNDACIVKISYYDGVMKNDIIKKEDIVNIFMRNYYHKGVLIDTNDKMVDIEFTGDNPNLILGNSFKQFTSIQILDFVFLIYQESSKELNKIMSKLTNQEVKGRCFCILLSMDNYKKYWDIDSEGLNEIITMNENNIDKSKLNIENNPFLNLKINNLELIKSQKEELVKES